MESFSIESAPKLPAQESALPVGQQGRSRALPRAFAAVVGSAAVVLCVKSVVQSRSVEPGAATDTSSLRIATDPQVRIEDVSMSAMHCADLTNRGTHSTIRVEIGTPPQALDLVADTGSDNVIAMSCACVDNGHCDASNTCFRGTGRSSTFELSQDGHGNVEAVGMRFGSGNVQSVVATDVVRIASVDAVMDHGLLLMIDQQLDIGTSAFEGILGLGIPTMSERPDFMQAGNVSRFSICFNEGSSGKLRLFAPPSGGVSLTSVSSRYWQVNFGGMSVGAADASVSFCGGDEACVAIPDSGTTMLMGPQRHIDALYESLCDAWPRCVSMSDRLAAQMGPMMMSKGHVFDELLHSCATWIEDGEGLAELPSIFLRVAGANGGEQTIEISSWAYVLETVESVFQVGYRRVGDVAVPMPMQGNQKVCTPAFATNDVETGIQTPSWILGTSLFYEYNVYYDSSTNPPSMEFAKEGCGRCDGSVSFLAAGSRSRPRHVSESPRKPSFNNADLEAVAHTMVTV